MLTAGAAEAFVLLARALRPRHAVVVHPQFTEPEAALRAAGHQVDRVMLPFPFTLDPELVPADADLVFVGNPTNPTSVAHPRAALLELIRPGRLVVVDEAFADCLPGERESLAGHDLTGLVVIRSLTKAWGLAGLRVGYLLAAPGTVRRLAAAQPLWAVSAPALTACVATASPPALREVRQWAVGLAAERAHLLRRLDETREIRVGPAAAASFVLLDTRIADIRARLLRRGFAVRRGETFPGLGPGWIRVAVRDTGTSDLFAAALADAVRPFRAVQLTRKIVSARGRVDLLPDIAGFGGQDCAMGAGPEVMAGLAAKFAELRPYLDELRWRLYLGSEARAYAGASGCGLAAAVAVVAGAAGVSRAMVMSGAHELAAGAEPMPGRSRRPGAGRKKLEERDPGLAAALTGLLAAGTRGDPVSPLVWTTLSLREIAAELARRGWRCGKDTVARMLREDGYSLQGMAKVLEGRQHPDRDAQFQNINAMITAFSAAGDPVISVDAKKKEQLGPYHRAGRSWRRRGDPVRVRDHDFADPQLGKIIPYGVYDIAANRGFVSVGVSGNTAAFAVNALQLWWRREGSLRYPGAGRVLVVCDAGNPNGYACRGWKDQLAGLAAETGLQVTVCHLPPGTSKWNKIEHRLFCHITRSWRARPLMTRQDAVAGIAATTTVQGLKCTAVLDEGHYPTGQEVSDERMKELEKRVLDRHAFHGEWNYTIGPAPAPAPAAPGQEAPAPAPGAALAALAALAGISDFCALLAAVAVPAQAAREQRLYLDRGAARRVPSGPAGPIRLPFDATVAAAACHHRAGVSYRLLGQILGVDQSTISAAASHITPVLAQHGITPRYQRARIRTLDQLRGHAAASGTKITAITIQAPQPTRDDTPETVN